MKMNPKRKPRVTGKLLAVLLALPWAFPSTRAQEAAPVTLSVTSGYNFTSSNDHNRTARVFRERVISTLAAQYACRIVSRNVGIEMAAEESLRALQDRPDDAALLAADWVVTPMLEEVSSRALQWKMAARRIGHDTDTIELAERPIPADAELDDAVMAQAAHDLAALLKLPRRDAAGGPALRETIGRCAVMPAIEIVLNWKSPPGPPLSELVEALLQEAGVDTVSRADFRRLLDERKIENLLGSTEQLAGQLGRLAGAETILRPVWMPLKEDSFIVEVQAIDTKTGAVLGVVGAALRDPGEWPERAPELVRDLLSRPMPRPAAGRRDERRLLEEADHHAAMAQGIRYVLALQRGSQVRAGIEHVEAAYALARNDAGRLSRILETIEGKLVIDPANVSFDYWAKVPKVPQPDRLRLRALTHDLLDRLRFLGAAAPDEDYHRMRAHYNAGEYREALRILDAASPTTRNAEHRARLLFLLKDFDQVVAAVEAVPAEKRTDALWWALAGALDTLERDRAALDALKRCAVAYQYDNRVSATLLILLDKHAPADERIAELQRLHPSFEQNGLSNYNYVAGRAWAELGERDRAVEYFRRGYLAAKAWRPETVNYITGRRELEEFADRLRALGADLEPSVTQHRRAADARALPENRVLYLQPTGAMDLELVRLAAHRLQWFYGARVVIRPPIPLPKTDYVYKQHLNQYQAALWLHLLTHGYPMPEDALYVTYFTDQDIFSQGVVWSYMSARPEVGAIASVNRFRREMRLDSGDLADVMARIAVSSHPPEWLFHDREQ